MHSHKNKLSLFKSNKSQASLLSAQEGRSHQASPIDSPLQSPAFPPNSAVSSLDPEDRDDTFDQRYPHDSDVSKYYKGNGTIPQRSQSQRTPPAQRSYIGAPPTQPTIQLVGTPQGSAGASTIDENPDAYYQQDQSPAKVEQKKKRRFFGFGETTNHKDFVNKSSIGRSISTRRLSLEPRIVTNLEHYSQQRWPSGSTSATYSPSVGIEEEEGGTILASHYPQYPKETPPIPPKDPPKSPQPTTSPEQERSYTTLTTAPKQTGGEHQAPIRPSTWDRTPRSSYRNPNQPSEQQPQYQAYPSVSGPDNQEAQAVVSNNYPLPVREGQEFASTQHQHKSNSRPPSRQTYEPPSPGPNPTQFRQRNSSLPGGPEYSEAPMAPPPTQANTRSTESTQQGSQNGSNGREGPAYQSHPQGGQGGGQSNNGQPPPQYGAQLSVNNQPGGNYRGTPQPSPMVQQNGSDQGRSTPPPNRSRDDLSGHDVAALQAKYDELSGLIIAI